MTITLRSSRRETPHDLACSQFVAGLALRRPNLRRAGALHGSEIQVEQGLLFVALVLVLLAQAQDFPEDFHVEALSLGLCEDFFLPVIQRLDLVVDVLDSPMKERMRSPEIPAVSVMPAPSFKRAYGIATKVTEKLIEPPIVLLTRSLMLPLALVSTNRVSRRNHGYV